MNVKKIIPTSMAMIIVMLMIQAAYLLDNKEIIFPEIAAIAIGGLIAPKMVWNTNKRRILFFITLCAVFGIGIVRYVPLPLWMQMTIAFFISQILFIYSGTTFAPMISAIVLPVMLQTDTVIYILSAILLTTLILVCRLVLEKADLTGQTVYQKTEAPQKKDYQDVLKRLLIAAVVIFAAVSFDVKFVVAPPLLVAFTEFSKPSCGARKRAFTAVLLTGASALIGAVFRYLLCIRFLELPLSFAAALTILAVILLMKKVAMFIPPAAAVSILAMLIPAPAVPWFPLQITLGATVAMAAALVFFKDQQKI